MRTRRLAMALAPAGVGLLSFAVYLQTLLPGVGWGDIARFLAAHIPEPVS